MTNDSQSARFRPAVTSQRDRPELRNGLRSCRKNAATNGAEKYGSCLAKETQHLTDIRMRASISAHPGEKSKYGP